jgi:hypothetical protein
MLIGWLYWNVAWNLWHHIYYDHQEKSAKPWCEPVSEWNPPWLIISPRKSPTILQRRSAAMPRAHFASESTRKNLSCATYRSDRIEFISVYNIVYKVNQQLLHVPLTIDSSIKTIAPYPWQLQACVHPKRNSCRKANIVTYRGETNRIHWIPSWDPADNLANAEKTNRQIFCSWCAKVKLSYGWMTGLRTSNLQKAPFFLWCDCP